MSKYVINLLDDCKLVQQICQSDKGFGVSTKSADLFDELNDSYINEHFGSLLQDRYDQGYKDGRNVTETQAHGNAYQQGLEDAWEYAKKIVLNHEDGGISISEFNEIFDCYTIQYIFKNYTLQQIIEKLEAYEKKQKADDEIKAGDEVIWTATDGDGAAIVVTRVYTFSNMKWCDGFSKDGRAYSILAENARKTGRRFNIQKVLGEMQK